MGADLYINSLNDAHNKIFSPIIDKAIKVREMFQRGSKESDAAQEVVKAICDLDFDLNEGYFRDSYNATGLASRLNLSWWDKGSLGAFINKKGVISGKNLSGMLALLEASRLIPLTLETLKKSGAKVDDKENSVEEWNKFFEEKRLRLIKFVKRAIELKEPIRASV